jgi:hypothetical protein
MHLVTVRAENRQIVDCVVRSILTQVRNLENCRDTETAHHANVEIDPVDYSDVVLQRRLAIVLSADQRGLRKI